VAGPVLQEDVNLADGVLEFETAEEIRIHVFLCVYISLVVKERADVFFYTPVCCFKGL
jgi:hypothetical protein